MGVLLKCLDRHPAMLHNKLLPDAQTLTLTLSNTTLLLSLQVYTVKLQWKLDTLKNCTLHCTSGLQLFGAAMKSKKYSGKLYILQ